MFTRADCEEFEKQNGYWPTKLYVNHRDAFAATCAEAVKSLTFSITSEQAASLPKACRSTYINLEFDDSLPIGERRLA